MDQAGSGSTLPAADDGDADLAHVREVQLDRERPLDGPYSLGVHVDRAVGVRVLAVPRRRELPAVQGQDAADQLDHPGGRPGGAEVPLRGPDWGPRAEHLA